MRARRKGFTLMEVIVALALLSLLLTAVYSVAIAGVKDFLNTANTIELEQAALTSLGAISRELVESDVAGFSPSLSGTSPPGIVFASPRDPNTGRVTYDSSGNIFWQQYVCYYVRSINGTSCLVRAHEPIARTTLVPSPSLNNKTTSYFSSKPDYTLMGTNVVTFQTGWINPNVVSITLKTEKKLETPRTSPNIPEQNWVNQIQAQSAVWIRN